MGPEVLANSLIGGVLLGGMFALSALGLSLVLGVLRLVNLAHGEFLVIGAYAGFYLLAITGIDPLMGLPIIAAGLALIAAPFHWWLIRPLMGRGPDAPMMTMFGLSIVLQNLFLLAFSADTRSIETSYSSLAVSFGPVTVGRLYLIGFAVSVVIIGIVHVLLSRSAFGRDLRASAQDPVAAAIVGVNVGRIHLLTFMLGAACAGVGGTLTGLAFSFTPSSGAAYLLNSFTVVVLGGLGSVPGTLVAGIAIGVLQSIGGSLLGDGYRDVIALALFLSVLTLRPEGFVSVRR